MKRIGLFNGTSRRRSRSVDRSRNKYDTRRKTSEPEHTDTLIKLQNVKQEATRKWEEEQEQFYRRKLKHNTHVAEIERQEILRREDALSNINLKIDEMRKKHRTIESVFENQILLIEEKLRNQKSKHKEEESVMLQKVADMETQIAEVQSMYQKRVHEIQTPFTATNNIPLSGVRDDISTSSLTIHEKSNDFSYRSNMYPPLPPYSSTSVLQQNDVKPNADVRRNNYTDSWLRAGYIGSLSDSENTLSIPTNTLKLQ